MKRVLLLAALVLSGCSTYKNMRTPVPVQGAAASSASSVIQTPVTRTAQANGVQIERVPFRVGVSSATVESLAREQSCPSAQGAGLMTEPGPVEVYRVQCDNGQVFMARCEMRQCRKM